MNEKALANQSFELIKKDFDLIEELSEMDSSSNVYDKLEEFLVKHIDRLLDADLSTLLNALYRIDLPEQRVKELLHCSEPDQISKNIAKAIIKREQQKVLTRLKYQP